MTSSQTYLAHNYKITNAILVGIILSIFLYSSLFSPESGKYPIPSFYTQLTGQDSPSTGLSRSFSAIVRGDLTLANKFNPFGVKIFAFFLIQFCFRISSILMLKATHKFLKTYITADILISIFSFYLAFKPLIVFSMQLFKNTLAN